MTLTIVCCIIVYLIKSEVRGHYMSKVSNLGTRLAHRTRRTRPTRWSWESSPKWTVQRGESGRSIKWSFTDRPLWIFWTFQFDTWQSSFSRLNRPVLTSWTVHFDPRPSTLDLTRSWNLLFVQLLDYSNLSLLDHLSDKYSLQDILLKWKNHVLDI